MTRKLIYAILVVVFILGIPSWIQPKIILSAKLWILIGIAIVGSLFQPRYDAFEPSRTIHDRGTALQIIWSIYAVQFLTLLEAALRYPTSMKWGVVSWISLALMLLGLCLRSWSFIVLGKYFTWHIDIQTEQTIVNQGPYRLIRHPSYTGAFLTYFFSTTFFHCWFTAIGALAVLGLAFTRRIIHEEKILRISISGYSEYAKITKAVIPFLL
ncbi:MAG: isoprenylcysteine carboxylmethyltransferase family protein [Myxococcales bacterium]|nr:MAG: isoprenylcysteine carboxylmethyltransferase family protein [Myxococcales bacterium]